MNFASSWSLGFKQALKEFNEIDSFFGKLRVCRLEFLVDDVASNILEVFFVRLLHPFNELGKLKVNRAFQFLEQFRAVFLASPFLSAVLARLAPRDLGELVVGILDCFLGRVE